MWTRTTGHACRSLCGQCAWPVLFLERFANSKEKREKTEERKSGDAMMGWGDFISGWAAALAGVGRGVTSSLGGALGFDRAQLRCSLGGLAVGAVRQVGSARSLALPSLWLGNARTLSGVMIAQRLSGDRSATGAGRTATFGDNRRQNLGLRMETGCNVLQSWQSSVIRGGSSEAADRNRLMAIYRCTMLPLFHLRWLMGLRLQAAKGSVDTTKNDNWRQNEKSAYTVPQNGRTFLLVHGFAGGVRLQT